MLDNENNRTKKEQESKSINYIWGKVSHVDSSTLIESHLIMTLICPDSRKSLKKQFSQHNSSLLWSSIFLLLSSFFIRKKWKKECVKSQWNIYFLKIYIWINLLTCTPNPLRMMRVATKTENSTTSRSSWVAKAVLARDFICVELRDFAKEWSIIVDWNVSGFNEAKDRMWLSRPVYVLQRFDHSKRY